MYDAVGGSVDPLSSNSKGGIYEVPADMVKGIVFLCFIYIIYMLHQN